jgi:cytidylate kinase
MLSLEELIAKQIQLYEENRRAEKQESRAGRGKVGEVSYGPYLLMSREKGSGGQAVAQRVGERLNWKVFDHEIVDEIARRAQVRQQLINSLDERDRNFVEGIVTSTLERDHIGEGGYLLHLKQVLLTLGQHGDVIILGRGAQHVLPRQFGLTVRCVAPLEVRAQRITAQKGVSAEAAKSAVQSADRERAAFIRRHFSREVSDPLNYDLTLNIAELGVEAATEILLSALQQKLGISAAK